MNPLGDRRRRVRMEIVGSLWGTLELTEPGRLVNISPMGALIASPVAMAPNSTQTIKLVLDGDELTLEARVCHFRRADLRPEEPPQYLVGLEFLAMPAAWANALG